MLFNVTKKLVLNNTKPLYISVNNKTFNEQSWWDHNNLKHYANLIGTKKQTNKTEKK